MDNIISVLQREDNNQSDLILYQEGVFYKAYGRSAYLFTKHVRPYRPKKYYYKKVKSDICSIGFPTKVLDDIVAEGKFQVERTGKIVTLRGSLPPIEEEAYKEWVKNTALCEREKKGTARAKAPQASALQADVQAEPKANPFEEKPHLEALPYFSGNTQPEGDVEQRILQFAIESVSPLECQRFLADLKKMIIHKKKI